MKKIFSQVIGSGIIASLLIVPMLSVRAETEVISPKTPTTSRPLLRAQDRIENREVRATNTLSRLENRENNIERILGRLASTTASTSAKKVEKLDSRLAKQREQMEKVKERIASKEMQVTKVLNQIASKIQERIDTLTKRNLDTSAAQAKLEEAKTKISSIITEGDKIATLIETTITEANKVQIFTDIKTSQDKIKVLANESHALLVDTVKEITKVLPAKNKVGTSTESNN